MTTALGNDLVGPGEAARRLEISAEHLRRLALAGKLAFTPSPLGRLYSAADVNKLRAERDREASQRAAA